MSSDKFRVVAVDDAPDILELITITLSPQYEVITVADPGDAADLLEFAEPDLAIIDIMMPRITGYQILEGIRRSPKLANTLVILLSAKDSEREIKYGYKLGANFYLTKPFQPDRLARAVEMQVRPLGHPRHKALSIRDVEIRRQAKVSSMPGIGGTGQTPNPDEHHGEEHHGPRLKRPLAQEKDWKKWVG